MERGEVIQRSSADQREKLRSVDIHLTLLQRFGGEEGLKIHKESSDAALRGLSYFEGIFGLYDQIWDNYTAGILQANEKAGMPLEQQTDIAKKLNAEREITRKRAQIVHSLVFKISASPEALALNKTLGKMVDDFNEKYEAETTPRHVVTRDEFTKISKQMDQVFEEIKNLPTLPPGELQKEYDAFPEERLIRD